jgi:hypothetical protein
MQQKLTRQAEQNRLHLAHAYRLVTIQLALSPEYRAQLTVFRTAHFCGSQQRAVLSEGHENQSCLPNNILVIHSLVLPRRDLSNATAVPPLLRRLNSCSVVLFIIKTLVFSAYDSSRLATGWTTEGSEFESR